MKITKNILLSLFLGLFAFSNVLVLIPTNVALATSENGNGNGNQDKVKVCHKTESDENPWVYQKIDESAWISHEANGDFLYTGPDEGNINDKKQWCKDNAPKVVDEEPEKNPGSIKVCKIILDEEGYSTIGELGSDFTISFSGTENYEGSASSVVPEDVIFSTPLNYNTTKAGYSAECEEIDDLPYGRYYYLEESISSSFDWEVALYNDGALGSPSGLGDFGEFNINPNPSYDDFDGVINLSQNNPSRTLVVVNREKEVLKDTATVVATKIVCDSEADLPNWGAEGPNITSDTVSDFLSDKGDRCRVVPWNFEWATSSTPNPGDSVSVGGEDWTVFSETTTISTGSKIWVREQADENYIPFTGQNTTEDVSAEFYCHTDVLNYDNYDWIDPVEADETYYCVGFNVPKESPEEPKQCNVVSDRTNIVEDGTNAVETWNHPTWYDETLLGGVAKWIWETYKIVDPVGETTKVFVKEFNLNAVPASASIEVAADNSFIIEINGYEIANEPTEYNYQTTKTYLVTNLVSGVNTIRMTVKNFAQNNGTESSNPAGALYNLTVVGIGDCADVTPTDMCLNIDGYQSSVPVGLEQDNEGNCVKPGPQLICDPDVNLLLNGGFESPVVTSPNKWDTFVSGTAGLGWIVEWISGELGSLELQRGVNGWVSSEGYQHAELDSTAATKIWQDIITIPGKTYKLEFDYSPRPKVVDNGIEVYRDGVLLDTLLADGSSNNNTSWTTKTYTFTADDEAKIEFKDISKSDSFGGFLDNVGLYCQNEPEEPTTGTIRITKYECPLGTTVVRSQNGVDGQVPVGCILDEGATFGYVHGDQTDADSPYPELNQTPIIGGTTNSNGILEITNLDASGRYLVVETDSEGNKLGHNDILGLYCEGDGDTSNNNDNQELTFVPAGGVSNCIAYNKSSETNQEYNYVTTNPATLITETSVVVNGTNGDFVAQNEAFWYGTTLGGPFVPAVGDASGQYPAGWVGFFASTQDLSIGGEFSSPITSLTSNTKYYFVAWSFVDGTWYPGEVLSFKTANIVLENISPNADAGEDQEITLPTNGVTLDASGSSDNDGTITSYVWSFISGPSIINPDDVSNPNITGLIEGNYIFELTVIDNDGATDTDTVQVKVNPAIQSQRRTTSSGSHVGGGYVLGASTDAGQVLGAEASCGIYIDRYVRRGYENDRNTVIKIQQFLNDYMNAGLKVDGIYGVKTEKAVMDFQEKFFDRILLPWGLEGPTGIFYITTQTQVNNIMCPELNLQIPTLIPFEFNSMSPNKA